MAFEPMSDEVQEAMASALEDIRNTLEWLQSETGFSDQFLAEMVEQCIVESLRPSAAEVG